ncbi:portal protein [Halorubrum tailed virus 28]|uniref:Portal protein n=1 Tax=Halorubrum tailed virus 28 TaxID=2878009 RepID=A0AAE8XZ68_9CAUD|nr:head morphogenesis [Halorubrum tailed virus 28]UBF23447.1 portal protein [Halorubrum tailed virus 28]
MPALRPGATRQIVPSDPSTAGERRGRRRHSQLLNQKGIPRYDDLLTTRLLEQTPTISLPMNTATKQARAIPWDIQPTVDNPTPTHNMMADRIYEFIDGNFNDNGQTWDQLLGLLLNDSLSIDTGAAEFVPTESPVEHPQTGEPTYWLSEVYAVDGTIVSKNLDEHDRIPDPPEPAYFKWGNTPNINAGIFDSGLYDSSWFDRFQTSRLLSGVRQRAVPMTRDELAILETNAQPRELSAYGRGVVQQVRPWAEILLNQDRANVRHFSEDEYAKGILNIGDQYAGEIDAFREYWKDEVKGDTDTSLPIVASEGTEFIPFQETLKELQYLESQNWYSKLVWLLFGESTSTVGLAEDANTATAEAQSEDVLYNTTKPRLEALAEWMNNHWLPKMREYWVADGELEFVFNFDEHPIIATKEREKRRDDLSNALRTPNEVRTAEDRDPLPWGDMPSEAVSAFAREHPEWVAENWGGIENVPEPASEDAGGLFGHAPRTTDDEEGTEADGGNAKSPAPDPSETGNTSETTSGRIGTNGAALSQTRTKQKTYTDYPDAAVENAQMALDARDETGNPNDCGTDTGWARANQLADREPISEETVARMAAFRRHQDNAEMSDDEGRADCGWMMWKAWGGEEGIAWAERAVDSEETDGVADLGTITLWRDKTGTWRLTPASDDVKDDFEDPCWDGYTMVGTDENGDPICVPDDEVPDARDETKPFGFDNEYANHDECVADNQDKDDPDAYCAWLADETKGRGISLETALQNPDAAKDALRNERDGDLPDLTHVVDKGTEALGEVIREVADQAEPELDQRWPDDPPDDKRAPETKRLGVDIDGILDRVSIRDGLVSAITGVVGEAMREGADTEADKVAEEIAERVDDADAEIIASFDVEDTAAYERMVESAADDMVTVEETIKDKVRNTLVEVAEDRGGVQEATQRLRDEVDELSDSHARLVARTETLDASRHGSQALAESADAIGGKRWRASNDNRTRWWHEAMDGVVVEVNDDFTVPTDGDESGVNKDRPLPKGFPKKAYVVGDCDPYNCRCVSQSVLAEDMPDDATAARDYDGLEVRFTDAHRGEAVFALEYDLSERQFEVREEAREEPGESFADVWKRVRADRSKSGVVDDLGMSKTTVGKWDAQVGL